MLLDKSVNNYLLKFPYRYKIRKDCPEYKVMKQWCEVHLGNQYKDWFWWRHGMDMDVANIYIKDSRKNTFFVLRWGDNICNL